MACFSEPYAFLALIFSIQSLESLGLHSGSWVTSIFFIRGALSAAKTKFYSSPPTPIASTSSTVTPTHSTTRNSRAKVVVLPYHSDFDRCNSFMQDSNIKIVFSSGNSIGRSVVDKKGLARQSTQRLSGVYSIPCTSPGCNQPYFGRTMMDLHVRTTKHNEDISKGKASSALVQHIQSHPGHGFDPSSARLIWKTRSKYECQFVEASCIKKFSSCNVSPGEISVSAATASITTRLANLDKPLTNIGPRRQHRSPLYVSRPSAACTNQHSPLQLPTTSPTVPPTQTVPIQTIATLSDPPTPAQIIPVRTHSPDPASTSPTSSPVSSTNAAFIASQPLLHTTQLAYLSPRTLPATQSFIRDHHGCKPTSFSPRRLRSHNSKKKCLDPPGTDPHSS